jgi:hypothetical protein
MVGALEGVLALLAWSALRALAREVQAERIPAIGAEPPHARRVGA